MIFKPTHLEGAFLIELQKMEDERGFFARTYCQREFHDHGIPFNLAQCSLSYNRKKGTLRGMHFQASPYQEAKLVSCVQGSIYDVIVDIRPASPTYREYLAVELAADKHNELYVPQGFAHGFLTLQPDTYVFYQMSEFFEPGHARGFRWNDPAFAIDWPAKVELISERDASFPDYSEALLA